MTGNVLNNTVTINFLPSVNVKPEYFATSPQTVTLPIDVGREKLFYITDAQRVMTNIFLYLCYAIIAFAWLSCILGFILRRLSGL